MAGTFTWYTTAALTTELTGLFPNGTSHTYSVWYGSATAGKQVQAVSDPGVDQIVVTPTDADIATGHPATDIKLALTEPDLASATPGAALNLGTVITSAAPVEVWIELTDSTGSAAGVDTDLSLVINQLEETTSP